MIKIDREFDELDITLRELNTVPVLFVPNFGNIGDALIAAGTYQAFANHGINYVLPGQQTDDVHNLIYGGGGNLTGLYPEARKTIIQAKKDDLRVTILPHSIRNESMVINRLDSNDRIFCRDLDSLRWVGGRACSNIYLAPDMAFYLSAERVFSKRTLIVENSSAELLAQYDLISDIVRDYRAQTVGRVAYFLRRDGERKFGTINQVASLDPSNLIIANWEPDEVLLFTLFLLETCSDWDLIITDRLHIAIACALLKRPAMLLDNIYGKNASMMTTWHKLMPTVMMMQEI
jgi:exopolysaccharide biosynthesis predicted pyruvyltransferase EpsI